MFSVEIGAGLAAGSAALQADAVDFLGDAANYAISLFGVLWRHRTGDANMRSAWICTRNDVLGNLAVLLAAAGVLGTGTGWPDVIVAAVMAMLALQGATKVIRQAKSELRLDGHMTRGTHHIGGLRHGGGHMASVERHR